MRPVVAIAAFATASCLTATAAAAHAFLDHAVPAVGSTVHQAPAQVRLWFTQELEPAFSTVEVVDAADKRVDTGDKHLDPKDASVLEVSLPPLHPGKYRVKWHALSVDTHVTEGDFTFTVTP
jgi:methionine-rich copper-binding protein CopC